jgi:hypothetical protein
VIWPKKPKTPGFGISRNYYITVLAATATLPPARAVMNPKAEGGAIAGFIVPLAKSATKADLDRPLMRGSYALGSPDRKTVLQLLVLSKDEVGYDPASFLRSEAAVGLSHELLARISATWTLLQLRFESHDPMVYNGVRFALSVAKRLAELTEGVVSDPICQTYRLPDDVFSAKPVDPRIDSRDVVRVWVKPMAEGKVTAFTLGMSKFDLHEAEIQEIDPKHSALAEAFLYQLTQEALLGDIYEIGDKVGGDACLLQVALGGLDRARWDGIPCFELIPPTGRTMDEALLAWAAEVSPA